MILLGCLGSFETEMEEVKFWGYNSRYPLQAKTKAKERQKRCHALNINCYSSGLEEAAMLVCASISGKTQRNKTKKDRNMWHLKD